MSSDSSAASAAASSSATADHYTSTPSILPSSVLSNAHRADLTAEEYFDVLTSDNKPTGIKKLRKEVHRDGDWHASVHIWIIHRRTGKILLQKRAACKDSFPGRWDVSCAGHLAAGETAHSAALAELAEELGVTKPESMSFNEFFQDEIIIPREVISQGGKFIDREHTYVYCVEGQWELNEFVLQPEEVEEVQWMDLDEVVRQFTEKNTSFVNVPDADVYIRLVFNPIRKRVEQILQREKNAA